MKVVSKVLTAVALAGLAYALPHWWLFVVVAGITIPAKIFIFTRSGALGRKIGWGRRQLWWTYGTSTVSTVAELTILACFGKWVAIVWLLVGSKAFNYALNIARIRFGRISKTSLEEAKKLLAR